MAQDRSTTDTILTEHFQYTPLSVIDAVINSVNTIIYKALIALETSLLSQSPRNLGFTEPKTSKTHSSTAPQPTAAETQRTEIENGVHALETLLYAAVDKNFDIFELFVLQNIFSIKPDVEAFVRLPHYDGLVWPLTHPGTATPERIRQARIELNGERELGLALQRENKVMEAVLQQLKDLVNPNGSGWGGVLLAGKSQSQGGGTQPLTTTAQFSTSQLPGLRVLLAELQSKMAKLPASAEELRKRNITRATSEEERRRYVESVAKRAVREKLGSDVSGEHELGPARSMSEVEALEALISGIVRDGGDEGNDDEDDVD